MIPTWLLLWAKLVVLVAAFILGLLHDWQAGYALMALVVLIGGVIQMRLERCCRR